MPLLKKINPSWNPSENPGLAVGEIIDFPADPEALVRGRMAVMVDQLGNEVELPGIKFKCPVCFTEVEGLSGLINHITIHLPKNTAPAVVSTVNEPAPVEPAPEAVALKESVEKELEKQKAEDIKARRLAGLVKAREARKAANAKA